MPDLVIVEAGRSCGRRGAGLDERTAGFTAHAPIVTQFDAAERTAVTSGRGRPVPSPAGTST